MATATVTTAPAIETRQPKRRRKTSKLPYFLLIPALVLELAVHIIPMLVGVWMSLLELTQFHIRSGRAEGLTSMKPPSTTNDAPVVHAASSEQSHAMQPAISRASPGRGIG